MQRRNQTLGRILPRSKQGTVANILCGLGAIVLGLAALAPTNAVADGEFVWATAMGGTGSDEGNGIAVDSAGNVYTTGSFRETANFGPFQFTSVGLADTFVAKHALDGSLLWARAMGGTIHSRGQTIAVDAAGNVYTTGSFWGTVDFDPGPETFELTSANIQSIFVSKLNTDGEFVWARAMGDSLFTEGWGIAVDAAGNVYTSGSFTGTVDFDPGQDTFNLSSTDDRDIFISKLDASGDFVWARSMGGLGDDFGFGIAVDEVGNVYTTGHVASDLAFGQAPGRANLTATGTGDVFVAKLDTDGEFVWTRTMGGVGNDFGFGIAVDGAGNVYTSGYFQGTADFDPGPDTFELASMGLRDAFVSKLDADGQYVWVRAMGGTGIDTGRGIAVDGVGNVYTTGYFQGTAVFDPGPNTFNLTAAGETDVFVAKLDPDGQYVWVRAMGGTGFNSGSGIAVDAAGDVYITGHLFGTMDFDPGLDTFELTSQGGPDIFVLKLRPDVAPPSAVSILPSTTGPTNAASVDFTVTFNEAVVNFADASDLLISHSGTASTGASISGGPVVYTVTVEGISGDGSFTVAVSAVSGVADLTGNLLTSSVTSVPVVIDNTPPVITVLGVSPAALEPGDTALIQFAVNEMLLGDPVVRVAGSLATVAPLEATKSLGHNYAWTAPADLPVGRITGRPFIPGVGYFNPDPWPYGPQPLEITVTDLAGNTVTYTDPHGLALVSGLPAGWPVLAALALLGAGAFLLRRRPRAG